MTEYKKPLPLITEMSKIFYDGCRDGKLLYQKCDDCNETIFFPKHLCTACMGRNLSWEASAGKGKIYSFTVTYEYAPMEFMDSTPYALAIINMDEGFSIMSNIVECDFESLASDMEVEVFFDPVTPEISLPKFRLVD